MADGGYVTILRTTDVAQGELLAEMLRREGIAARFRKGKGPLIGLPASLVEMFVEVPAESEAPAKELIADLEYAGAAEALDGEAGGAGYATEPDGPVRARRYPFLAAGFALILPGGAHLYARRPWSALVVAVGAVGCLIVIVAARSLLMFQVAVAILIAIGALDAIGGGREARTEIEGWSPARGAQLAAGFQILIIAVVVAGGGRLAYDQLFTKFEVRCTGRNLLIENLTGRARQIEISKVEIVGSSGSEEVRERIEVHPHNTEMLSADTRLRLDVPRRLGQRCWSWFEGGVPERLPPIPERAGLGEPLSGCHFAVRFVARKLAMKESDDPIEAGAACTPRSNEGEPVAGSVELLR